jgi:hypothetical protein
MSLNGTAPDRAVAMLASIGIGGAGVGVTITGSGRGGAATTGAGAGIGGVAAVVSGARLGGVQPGGGTKALAGSVARADGGAAGSG